MCQNEIVKTIQQAGKLRTTLWIRAYGSDGSVEAREVEPDSFRPTGNMEFFSSIVCYQWSTEFPKPSFKTPLARLYIL